MPSDDPESFTADCPPARPMGDHAYLSNFLLTREHPLLTGTLLSATVSLKTTEMKPFLC